MTLQGSHTDGVDVIHASHVDQYKDLLTGVMTDQVVTLAGGLVLSGANKSSGNHLFSSGSPWYDLAADAACDGILASDVACVSGNAQVSSVSALFKQSHVGKIFDLFGGSGPGITGTQVGTILSVQDAQHATLSAAPNANATNATLVWGTDDTAAANIWAARAATGRLRVGTGICIITGTVTFPVARTQVEGGGGGFWVSRRIGALKAFDIGALTAGSYLNNFSLQAPPGVTGRIIEGISSNEAGTLLLMRDVRVISFDTTDHDYLVFLRAMVATLDHCSFQNVSANPNAQKSFAHSAVISSAESTNCNFIGRVYINAQAYGLHNTSTGPLRIANNSAADGAGTAQQTNELHISGSSYIYSGAIGGTDFPCIQSVVATANGEGAAGGCFPNIKIDGTYLVMGGGASLSQAAISGNFAASQGSTSMICDGTGFQQSAASPATTVIIVNSTGGAPAVLGRGCAGNILSGVLVAKIFNAQGGTGECVWDFMPSGQATVWQHPATSTLVPSPITWPIGSGTATRNVGAIAYDIWLTPVSTITKIEFSSDNSTFTTLWTGTGAVVVPLVFRWPAGVYLKVTYSGAAPTYVLIPAP